MKELVNLLWTGFFCLMFVVQHVPVETLCHKTQFSQPFLCYFFFGKDSCPENTSFTFLALKKNWSLSEHSKLLKAVELEIIHIPHYHRFHQFFFIYFRLNFNCNIFIIRYLRRGFIGVLILLYFIFKIFEFSTSLEICPSLRNV